MKKLFLMFIFLSAIVSCGGETKETNKCDGVSCNEWEQCNATNGVCEVKSGRCETVQDCSGTNICDANHNCVNPDNPCENQTCSSHGTCVVENNSAKCNCETGFVADGLNCIADLCSSVTCDEWKQCNPTNGACVLKTGRCNSDSDCSGDLKCNENHTCYSSTNPCENQTCSAHGTCVVENNSAKCNCETGFVANGLSCEEKLCEEEAGQYVSCGENGEKQHQICTNNQWLNDGTCLCSNSTTRRTTCQGDGLQYQTCVDGSWADVGTCINTDCSTAGETRAVGCGFNGIGVQNQVCVNSKWTNTGTCTDPDECANGTTQLVGSCGFNQRGKYEQICANGQWIDYEGNCKDPDICDDYTKETIEGTCGINNRGIKYKKCVTGQWDFKDEYCNDPDICVDGIRQDVICGVGNYGLIPQLCIEGQWIDEGSCSVWTKQWGTTSTDFGNSVAVDSSGNIFVTGSAGSNLDESGNLGVFLTKFDNNGIKQWTKQWGSALSYSVAVDNSGNVFVTGFTQGGLDGNIHLGESDIFLTKFDNNGNKLWTKQWGTTISDIGNSVAVDSSGNIFVSGYTYGGLDGNINTGGDCDQYQEFIQPCSDIFLTKFDNAGNKLFTKQWGTNKEDIGNSVTVDSSENIFVTGYTGGQLDGNINIGYDDIFLTKFDNAGNKQWTKQWGTGGGDIGRSVAIDSSGNIFVTGSTTHNAGLYDIFLTKLDNAGNKLWTKQWGTTTQYDEGNSVAVDNLGNVFVAGYTNGGLDGNTNICITYCTDNSKDIFLTKFDNNGNKFWTKQYGTISDDDASSVKIDTLGNVLITGYTNGRLDGNTSAGSWDIFLIKFNAE